MSALRRYFPKLVKGYHEDKCRFLSAVAAEKIRHDDKMSCWQIHSYGNMDELQLQHTRIPIISNPNDVLIKVNAASVNPIDVAMVGGYGATALNLMRKIDNVEFPLILGRDFSGTVIAKGLGSCNNVNIGQNVWGVVPVHQQGSHAEYLVVNKNMIGEVPVELDKYEAAGMLYTGLTAFSGLRWSAGLNMKNMSGLRALVLGGSGGVGNAAIQLLKAAYAKVTATCSEDAIPLVEELGADTVIDYKDPDFEQKLYDSGRYDLIMDCAGLGIDYVRKKDWEFRNYVTLTTPLLKNLDSLGLVQGTITSVTDILCINVKNINKGRTVKWAYFVPSSEAIKHIGDLVKAKKMRVIVDKVYQFHDTPNAYSKVQNGHARGKVIIDIAESS